MSATPSTIGPRVEPEPWFTSSPYEPTQPAPERIEDIDLMDPELYHSGDPHAAWRLLRDAGAAHWVDRPTPATEGRGYWVVPRYEEVHQVHRNAKVFSSAKGAFPDHAEGTKNIPHFLSSMDAPEHRLHRGLVQRFFAPNAMKNYADSIQTLVDGLIDGVIERGSCDFGTDIASPMTYIASCNLMGISTDEAQDLHRMFMEMATDEDAFAAYNLAVLQFFDAIIRDRQGSERRETIVEIAANGEIDGRPITTEEAVNLMWILLLGGLDSTSHGAISGLLSLFHHPDQFELLLADTSPERIEVAVEEMLRWTSGSHCNRRWIVEDTELGGVRMDKGDFITTWFPSANRDERVFPEPYRFDVRRHNNRPIATFGGGPHHCLGAYFARLELRILFGRLFARLRDIEQAGPLVRGVGYTAVVSPVHSLPIRFTAVA
jgi:cytochrome P450